MSFILRLWNVLRGKTDAVLSKMENPAEQLSVVVTDLNNQLKRQHLAVAKAMADEKKLKMDVDDLINQSHEWEKKASYALQMNDENLAKQALIRKDEVQSKAVTLEKSWQAQKQATDSLRKSFQGAKDRVEDAKRQYTLLVAQYQSALSKQQISQTTSSLNENSAGAAIQKLKDKIQLLDAESEAETLLSSSDESLALDDRFKALESNMKADQALAQLKSRMGHALNSTGNSNNSEGQIRDVSPVTTKKASNQ